MFKALKKIFSSGPQSGQSDPQNAPAAQTPLHEAAEDAIARGNECLGAGKLEDARGWYEKAIAADGSSVSAYVNLGFVLSEQGRYPEAAEHLRKALELAPQNADALFLMGTVSRQQNQVEEAIGYLKRTLAVQPQLEMAYAGLAQLFLQTGQTNEAVQILRQGMGQCPQSAEFPMQLGGLYFSQGNHGSAGEMFAQAVSVAPGHAYGHFSLGNALQMQGKRQEAASAYNKAIALQPDFTAAYGNLGLVLLSLGRKEDALRCYERLLKTSPNHIDALINCSAILQEIGQYEEAAASAERALRLEPDSFKALANLGTSLLSLKRYEEALTAYEQAYRLTPQDAEILTGKGTVLAHLNRQEESLACYDEVLKSNANDVEALRSKGWALTELRRHEQALVCLDQALRLHPRHGEAHLNRSLVFLLNGDFIRGWEEYEWRWEEGQLRAERREFRQALWLGKEDLKGKTILLHAEQGLGDTIQFCRYAKLVSARGAKVVLEVQKGLKSLMRGLAGADSVVGKGEALPTFDYHTPLLSLPLAFKTTLETIPAETAYLRSDAAWVEKWKGKLGDKRKPRVGLVWSGNKSHKNDHNRSIPFGMLSALLAEEVEWVSLQKEVRESDEAMLAASAVKHYGEALSDFTDTAGLLSNMDLVISVDTSVAHLAGALGKPLWVLLPYSPDFRWLLDREDSPWYPSARLFRQPKIADWETVITRVGEELKAWAEART
jgi:tetratricopeptide (TPR) repeat protein